MKTKHNTDCKRVFSRYDATCPRCQELAAGKPARSGWNDVKNRQEAMQIEAIRAPCTNSQEPYQGNQREPSSPCLATMEAAMRAMEPRIIRELHAVDPQTVEIRQRLSAEAYALRAQARTQWELAMWARWNAPEFIFILPHFSP